mmetsp:Transcript_53660/g.95681  ORF Transcript_53660/g.95681 Transcript_53660/m.95681 type:complete len:81 (+) Transcript_53660:1228-1470(+)
MRTISSATPRSTAAGSTKSGTSSPSQNEWPSGSVPSKGRLSQPSARTAMADLNCPQLPQTDPNGSQPTPNAGLLGSYWPP